MDSEANIKLKYVHGGVPAMDLRRKILEILVTEKTKKTGTIGDIDWLYDELVKEGYDKQKEGFYEEFEEEFRGLEIEEIEMVAGGKAHSKKTRITSAGIAGLMMLL